MTRQTYRVTVRYPPKADGTPMFLDGHDATFNKTTGWTPNRLLCWLMKKYPIARAIRIDPADTRTTNRLLWVSGHVASTAGVADHALRIEYTLKGDR